MRQPATETTNLKLFSATAQIDSQRQRTVALNGLEFFLPTILFRYFDIRRIFDCLPWK